MRRLIWQASLDMAISPAGPDEEGETQRGTPLLEERAARAPTSTGASGAALKSLRVESPALMSRVAL